MKKIKLFIALVMFASCAYDPTDKRELSQFKGAEVLDKDTVYFNTITLKLPNGDIIHTGWYKKDSHYNIGDTIK